MYKQNPNSPVLKALKGNQGKLPQQLQDAIKAAPETPAKQTKAAERQMGPLDKTNPHKPGSAESEKYKKDYNTQFYDARAGKLKAGIKPPGVSKTKAPAKQTTAGEFAHKKSLKEKEMGKSTKAVDKVKAAYDAMTTDKTYAEAKKGYRKAAKEAYEVKPPAPIKQTKQRVRTGTPAVPSSKKRRVPPAPKVPVGPKAEKPKTKKEMLTGRANKKRYK